MAYNGAAMKMQGQHSFDAPRDQVWEALLDRDVLASSLPGFQQLEQVGDYEFRGKLAIGVGPVQGRFEGGVELFDLVAPKSYSLRMSGRGAPGFVQGQGNVRLEATDTGTLLHYDVDVEVGGRIAGVGQRLLDMTARMLTQQALKSLTRQVQARTDPVKPDRSASD